MIALGCDEDFKVIVARIKAAIADGSITEVQAQAKLEAYQRSISR